jgi:hypothetical protein
LEALLVLVQSPPIVSMKVRDVSRHHANWVIAATAGRSRRLAMAAIRRSMVFFTRLLG